MSNAAMIDDRANERSGSARRWSPAPGVVATALGDEVAFLDFATNSYFTVNHTGAHVWRLLEGGPRSIDEVTRSVANAFGVEVGDCRSDVAALLADMEQSGLVRCAPEDGADSAAPADALDR